MISFEDFYILIYGLMAIVTLFFINGNSSKATNIIFVIIFTVLWVILFGFRDFSIGSDTQSYLYSFNDFIQNKNHIDYKDYKDFGYYLFLFIITKFISSELLFLLFFEILIIVPLVVSFIKFNVRKAFFLFFLFCSFFFFKSMGINIMRQGVSISFFLLGFVYYMKSKKSHYITFFIIAFSFHASIFLPILIIFLSRKIKSPLLPICVYLMAIVLSFFNFDFSLLLSYIPVLSFLFEDRLQSYFNLNSSEYQIGFRLSFVLFNTLFAIIGYYFYRLNVANHIKYYNTIFYTYLLLSANFFLMFNIPYSDRSGLLSWIFVPLLLYPVIFNKIKYGTIKLYILCLLIFIFFYNI